MTLGCPGGSKQVSFEGWFATYNTQVGCVAIKQSAVPAYAAESISIQKWVGLTNENVGGAGGGAKFETIKNATAAEIIPVESFGHVYEIPFHLGCDRRFVVPAGLSSNVNVKVLGEHSAQFPADIAWSGGAMNVVFKGKDPAHGLGFKVHCFGDEGGREMIDFGFFYWR